ncbi:hypothetical protein GWA97_13700 [Flavobacterium sp. LaA7.5]|nr:hypothetical protein [Flavobacterium salilacus subsp. altitudinum]
MNLNKIIKYVIALSIVALNFSCQNKDESSKIEIYTLKSEVESEKEIYDSIQKEWVYAPEFEVTQNLLNENPLILNEEILCIDTISGRIKLSVVAINKIIALPASMKKGIKFAICKDKKPLLVGYFWSSLSSYGSTWNCIEYDHTKEVESEMFLNMYKGNGIDASKREKINFNNYPELLETLEKSERLYQGNR